MNTIRFKDVELIETPFTKMVAEEVVTRDVYRIGTIPEDCTVLDIGAFYGEFSIMCAKRGMDVVAFEPVQSSFHLLVENMAINKVRFEAHNVAVMDCDGTVSMNVPGNHPAGATVANGGGVKCVAMDSIAERFGDIAVKMDCESSEIFIFKSLRWLDKCKWVSMEFHNHDGRHFRDLLLSKGFAVAIEGGNGTPWDDTIGGGIIWAIRI